MKIVCFSDWQNALNSSFLIKILRRIKESDVLIFAGDGILNLIPADAGEYAKMWFKRYGKPSEEDFIRIVNFPKIGLLYVEGNDDPPMDLGIFGAIRLSKRAFRCRNFTFIGIPGSSGFIAGINKIDEKEIEGLLEKYIPQNGNIILVSHMPPYGILDRIPRGINIGSEVLREYVEKYSENIRLVISGHCHNFGGSYKVLGKTLIINCAMSVIFVEISEKAKIRRIF